MSDPFEEVWQEGFREGKLKGKRKGKLEGARNNAIEAAKRLLLGGKLTYEEIAEAEGLTVEEVRALDGKKSA